MPLSISKPRVKERSYNCILVDFRNSNRKPPILGPSPILMLKPDPLSKNSQHPSVSRSDSRQEDANKEPLPNLRTQKLIKKKPLCLAGRYLSFAQKRNIKCVDIDSGDVACIHKLDVNTDSGKHEGSTRATALSILQIAQDPDEQGQYIVSGSLNGKLFLVDVLSAGKKHEFGPDNTDSDSVVRLIPNGVGQIWSIRASGRLDLWDFGLVDVKNISQDNLPFELPKTPLTSRVLSQNFINMISSSKQIFLEIVDKTELWIAVNNKVFIFNLFPEETEESSSTPALAQNIQILEVDNDSAISSMHMDNSITSNIMINPMLWIGLDSGHVLGYSTISKKRVHSIDINSSLFLKAKDKISITSISCVGYNSLWIGTSNGFIAVLDTSKISTKTVKAIKLWRSQTGVVTDILVDRWAILTPRKCIQVSVVYDDEIIYFYDGMLAYDWHYHQLRANYDDYTSRSDWLVRVLSWNAGAIKPSRIYSSERAYDRDFLHNWLRASSGTGMRDDTFSTRIPDMIIINLQEVIDLESKSVNAKAFWKSATVTRNLSQISLSRRCKQWVSEIATLLEAVFPTTRFTLVESQDLVGMFFVCFIQSKHFDRVHSVSISTVKTGLGGYHGNKGAISIRLIVDDSAICLINAHLAAGESENSESYRNNDVSQIMKTINYSACPSEYQKIEQLPLNPPPWVSAAFSDFSNVTLDSFIQGGDGTLTGDYPTVILAGDLNYRINNYSQVQAIEIIKKGNLNDLLTHDQLRNQLAGFESLPSSSSSSLDSLSIGANGRMSSDIRLNESSGKTQVPLALNNFKEGPIKFPPTYKFDPGTGEYDSSEKKRVPAWCDRVLYRKSEPPEIPFSQDPVGTLSSPSEPRCASYLCYNSWMSDHKPISCDLIIKISEINRNKRSLVVANIQKLWLSHQYIRALNQSKVDWLTRIRCGLSDEDARNILVETNGSVTEAASIVISRINVQG
ncbi:putative inositol polyphosphate 5-phosphatase [Smittium mucronatum]|uniref:Putative inositol polyphosphate 5-phosphatase n=1 Tax=Smittium mucronatum TaxID=133383 RepID=A0A1R0GXD3_9FUNG|nr:putative inositol polyphosphate 5-phosphatase [Smittium mucronatum]